MMKRTKRQSWWVLTRTDAAFVAAGIVLFVAGVIVPSPNAMKVVLIVLGLTLIAFGGGAL